MGLADAGGTAGPAALPGRMRELLGAR
jgi:hypothetical protein